jgi:uncharacterized repeat protein (TIGR01451 family)
MQRMLQIVLALALLLPAAAWTQQKSSIEIKAVSEIEITKTNAEGKKEVKRVNTTETAVPPGQTVIFTNYYTYTGEKPATDVVINNPVPENMVYEDGTATGKGTKVEFSVDQGKTYAAAGLLKIKSADGKERRAAAADYTNIRWTIEKPLQKGAKGSVTFRAKVK